MSEFRVALTFDAEHPSRRQCPPGAAERILDTLQTKAVAATFFIQGRWATAYPEIAQAIVGDGHLVGNHSHSHWDVDAADWEEEQTAGAVSREIVTQSLEHGDGAVVLLHTWPAPTAAALAEIVERLQAANAAFVSVAELGRGA